VTAHSTFVVSVSGVGRTQIAKCMFCAPCDFIYAADIARFALPEGKLGIMPGGCGTQNLTRAVGERRAKELIMTGRLFTAAQARQWQLANEVVDQSGLLDAVIAVANEITRLGPLSVAQIKKSVAVAAHADLKTGYAFELAAYNRLIPTSDRIEGVAAFNDKRKPEFTGQ